jgi:hypothetical protein
MSDIQNTPPADEPTCPPPGGGSWEWRAGAWHQLEAPTRSRAEAAAAADADQPAAQE